MKRKNKMRIDEDDYVKTMRAILRKEELERQGGHWIAKDRPHKNKKAYDRKRDRHVEVPISFVLYKSILK